MWRCQVWRRGTRIGGFQWWKDRGRRVFVRVQRHNRLGCEILRWWVRFPCIQIIETATILAKLCKRESTKQFHNSKIKFPLNSDEAFMSDYVLILILGMHWIRNRTTLPVKKCV